MDSFFLASYWIDISVSNQRCFGLTVLWSARRLHIPSHTQWEPGPPTQELWGQRHALRHPLNSFTHLGKSVKCSTAWLQPAHRPSPATQCTATQLPGSSRNFVCSRFSQSSTTWSGGAEPSSKGQSWKRVNLFVRTKAIPASSRCTFECFLLSTQPGSSCSSDL